jgi:site-specific DNA-methyltransferase (adenine-specific)
MTPFYDKDDLTLHQGDCREVMASFDENSIAAIVTDPPYGIHFMQKAWDTFGSAIGHDHHKGRERSGSMHAGEYDYSKNAAFQSWCQTWGAEAMRVLKPGGHMVVCGSPRTYHRLAAGLEDAGFEIRDCLQWLFGSGFPKSLNLHGEWEGWGTALKPAYEPIVLARKPLAGTVAANVQQWGTGGLNIDACRIGDADTRNLKKGGGNDFPHEDDSWQPRDVLFGSEHGRWPANVALDEEAAALLDAMSGNVKAGGTLSGNEPSKPFDGPDIYGVMDGRREWESYADRGGASRFFYTAKTSRAEREFGLDDLEPARRSDGREKDIENPRLRTNARRNDHPTVKPVDLMRWLCRLITPPGGIILDPFLGSGSTGMAALDEGFRFIGIDLEERYLEIARRRIARRHVIEPLPQRSDGQAVLL